MRKEPPMLSQAAVFLAGAVAAGVLILRRTQPRPAGGNTAPAASPDLDARLSAHMAETAARMALLEERLDRHETRLAEIPSTGQIVAAMEQLLSKMVNSLDDRFKSQVETITHLQEASTQTDALLERVLESLDSLETDQPMDLSEPTLLEGHIG